MSRRFVSEHAGQFPVQRLCEVVEVPRSSYYEWSRRPLSQHYLDDVDLAAAVFEIHDSSRRTYGAPRIAGQLHDRGRHHGTKRIARLMAECGLVGVHGRKKWRRGKRPAAPAGDLLERDFTAERSDERWVADISEFKCRDGKLYLAGIKDLHDRGLAGWSMGERQTTDLVMRRSRVRLPSWAPRRLDGPLRHSHPGERRLHVGRQGRPGRTRAIDPHSMEHEEEAGGHRTSDGSGPSKGAYRATKW